MNQIDRHLEILNRASEAYARDHPHWPGEVMLSLIQWSLRSLQHCLEDTRDCEVTWDNPFIQLRYPIEWDWKAKSGGNVRRGGQLFGTITSRNTATQDQAKRTLAAIMARQFTVSALGNLTNGAWFEKRKNYLTPYLPVDLSIELEAIRGKASRRRVFEALVRPFAIGAALVNYAGMELEDGARVPKRVAQQLATLDSQIDVPRFEIAGEVNGAPFRFSLVFQIHPLLVDYDRKQAFHEIVVGLFQVPADGTDARAGAGLPAKWSKRDRKQLWQGLQRELGRVAGELVPKREAQDSVILTVNAKLKVAGEHWQPAQRSQQIKRISDALAASGALERIEVEAEPANSRAAASPACKVCGWFHNRNFTEIKLDAGDPIQLRGVLPDIVALVHAAHARGLPSLDSKDDGLRRVCGGYVNPCKAFYSLKSTREYKRLFDTSRRGFIALRGVIGKTWNKTEP